jgi:uncharacterized protein (TIGR03083 family)
VDTQALRAHLAREFDLLRAAVAAADLSATVPSCPDWTVADLAHHVAMVYLHKVECIRRQAFPPSWPPEPTGEPPLAELDRSYAALNAEFVAHLPGDPAKTWYEPEQTVGWWIRRMAHETVIHRVDAELGAGLPITPIPDDIALDGVDELLAIFIGYASRAWREEFASYLTDKPTAIARVTVTSDGGMAREWLLRSTPTGIDVGPAGSEPVGELTVSGRPDPTVRWLWNRASAGEVDVRGDDAQVTRMTELLRMATQ